MSQEDIEALRDAHEAFTANDLDRLLEAWHPECEYRPAFEGELQGRDAGIYCGREGIRRWWQEMREAWSEMSTEIEEIRDLGDGKLFSSIVLRVRAETAEIDLEAPIFQLVVIRDGRVATARDFTNRAAALEVAGLQE
jgi:ketosteroid isomerase-like protein